MRKTIRLLSFVFLILTGSVLGLYSQTPAKSSSKMPVDSETKLITYKSVVEIQGTPLLELQKRAFNWATSYYKNPGDVIRERDTLNGKMVCKARLKILNEADKKGVVTDAGLIEYTLKLDFKENKYRYSISDINWKQKSYYPTERWMDSTAPGYVTSYAYYLTQTDELMKQLVFDINNGMKIPTSKVKKDDW